MVDIDMSVRMAGVNFKNPIWAASGHITHTGKLMRKCIEAGVGAVETKSIGNNPEEWFWPRPANWFHDKYGEKGGLSTIEMAYRTPEQGVNDIKKIKSLAVKEDVVIIGDVSAPFGEPEKWAEMGRIVEEAGADIVEPMIGCPIEVPSLEEMKKIMKINLKEIMKALKETVSVPVIAKFLWQNEFYVREIGQEFEKAGADGIHINAFVPGVVINVETGRPLIPIIMHYGPRWRGTGNFSTAIAKKVVKIPIVSSGGIGTWYEVVERLMAGATLAAIQTAVQYKGYQVFKDLFMGLREFMEKNGYDRVEDMIGIATPHIGNMQEFGQLLKETCVPKESLTVVVDDTKCTGCKICASCNFGAIVMENGLAKIDLELCERCGVCASICPVDAITIKRITDGRNQGLDKLALLLGN